MADISTLFLTDVKKDARIIYGTDFNSLAVDPAHVITANAVLANQRSGSIQADLQAAATDQVVVVWGTSIAGVQDCTDDCAIEGDEGEAETLTIDAPLCKEITFSVSEETARRSGRSVESQTAFMLAQAAIELDTWVNSQTLVRLKALHDSYKAGTLSAPFVAGTAGVINVAAADYNRKLIAPLMKLARLNQMGSPYLIDSGSLFVDWLNANFDGANDNGRGDQARVRSLNEYFDIEGFADAGITEDTFVIKPGSVGLFHKHWNPDQPRFTSAAGGQYRTTFASPAINGMVYDMFSTESCVPVSGQNRTTIVHTHKLKAKIGVHKAAGVGAARPGILLLNQV